MRTGRQQTTTPTSASHWRIFASLRYLVLSVFLSSCAHTQAVENKVFLQGFAYLGEYAQLDSNFPRTLEINRSGALDKHFRQLIEGRDSPHFSLQSGLARMEKGESIVAAVAIDREQFFAEPYIINGAEKTRLVADASLQLLMFDFNSMTLIASEPVNLFMQDFIAGDQRPTRAHERELFERLYMDNDGILAAAADAFVKMRPHSEGLRFQVAEVEIAEDLHSLLPEGRSVAQAEHFIGQYFSSALAHKFQQEILPYRRDYALGKQLPGRFSNGDVFNLQVPVSDYEFLVQVKKLQKLPENADLNYFLAVLSFELREELSKKTLISDNFRAGAYKIAATREDAMYDWVAYEDACEIVLDGLVEQFAKPSSQWLKDHAQSKSTFKAFKDNKDLLRK